MEPASPRVEEVDLLENEASGLACPECHGGLWEVSEGDLTEYRCRTGHLYSPASLMHALSTRSIEEMESSHRALLEEAVMAEKMHARALARNAPRGRAERFRRRAMMARARADVVARAMVVSMEPGPEAAG